MAALPQDERVETLRMFGGVAAKVNGRIFAGLFGTSTALQLPDRQRAQVLAMKGASMFDPMGGGRARSHKVMLPPEVMKKPAELRRWVARAFEHALTHPLEAARPPAKKAKTKPKPKTRPSPR